MTSFNVEATSGPIQSEVSIKQPAVDVSAVIGLQSANKALSSIFDSVGKYRKGVAKAGADKALSDFNLELLRIGDAVDQKPNFSAASGRTRVRAALGAFTANNPGLTVDAQKAVGRFMSTAGIGANVARISAVDKEQEKMSAEAFREGYFSASDSPEDQQQGLDNYQRAQRAEEDAKDEATRITRASAKVGLSQKQLEYGQKMRSEKSLDSARRLAANQRARITAQTRNIGKLFRTNQYSPDPVVNTAMAVAAAEELKNTYAAELSKFVSADASDLAVLEKPINSIFDTFIKQIKGGDITEAAENIIKQKISTITVRLMDDKDVANLITTSKIFPQSNLALNARIDDATFNFLKKKKGDTPSSLWDINDKDEDGTQAKVIDYIKKGMTVAKGKGEEDTETTTEEVNTHVEQFLKSATMYEKFKEDPTAFNRTFKFLASPEYGDWIKANPVDPVVNANALEMFKTRYNNVAMPAIEKLWKTPSFQAEDMAKVVEQIQGGTPTQNFINAIWDNDGVRFIAVKEDKGHQSLARIYNEQMGKPINKLVRVGAHLRGHHDYEKIYNETFAPVFAEEPKSDLGIKSGDAKGEKLEEGSSTSNASFTPESFIVGGTLSDENGGAKEEIGIFKPTTPTEKPEHVEHTKGHLPVKFMHGVDKRVDKKAMALWSKVQNEFGEQLGIKSGYRSPSRNRKAGGAKKSQHMHGNALDIQTGHLSNAQKLDLINMASKAGFKGIGVYNNNLHFDIGTRRSWGPSYSSGGKNLSGIPSWARKTIRKHLSRT